MPVAQESIVLITIWIEKKGDFKSQQSVVLDTGKCLGYD